MPTDFGIAQLVEDTTRPEPSSVPEGSCVDGSLRRVLCESPPYMCPEQTRSELAEPRSDLYSLGVLAYEALCGRRPFDDANIVGQALAGSSRGVACGAEF